MYRLGILLSGRGTNFKTIANNCRNDYFNNVSIGVVITNKPGCQGIQHAKELNLSTVELSAEQCPTNSQLNLSILESLKQHKVDLIVLAGYMKIISPAIIREFPERIINIHPSLLPAFPGLNAQRQALKKGVKVSGCTVHFVDEGVDTGPIILQKTVTVQEGDTQQTLSDRILEQEHIAYSQAIKLWAQGRLSIQGNKVYIS